MKKELHSISSIMAEYRDEIKHISDNIHSNPETAFQEKKACKWQTDALREWGFDVTVPFGGLDTAFKASCGKGHPVFCFMSEYDALPEIGHACGHNLIAASALAAGVGLKKMLEKKSIPGSVVVMGTPAEEGKGGKVAMLLKSAFEGIDTSLISHPFYKTVKDCEWLTVTRFDVVFEGTAAHASVNPEAGINALDAVNLLFSGINAWRQQLPESSRVHGVINSGGAYPNIIPDMTSAYFYIRAESIKIRDAMIERFKNIVKGAALMTGCRYKLKKLDNEYLNNIMNEPFDNAFYELASEIGLAPEENRIKGRGSSDFANVSHIMPCTNLFFGITDGKDYPLHSIDFRKAAGSEHGFEQAMKTGAVMAAIGFRYMEDREFRKKVEKDFKERKET